MLLSSRIPSVSQNSNLYILPLKKGTITLIAYVSAPLMPLRLPLSAVSPVLWTLRILLAHLANKTLVNRTLMHRSRALISGPSPDVESLRYPAESRIFIGEKSLALTLNLTLHTHEKKWEALMPKSYMQRVFGQGDFSYLSKTQHLSAEFHQPSDLQYSWLRKGKD